MLRYDYAAHGAAENASNTASHATFAATQANNLVLRVLEVDASRPATSRPGDAADAAQELPTLDLIGAAIARAARIAAAEDRARLHLPSIRSSQAAILASRAAILASQAAGLLKLTAREGDALFADLASGAASGEGTDEGRLVPGTSGTKSVVWRLHPAPATAGAPVANRTTDTCGVPA
jgi:hypothetical protein